MPNMEKKLQDAKRKWKSWKESYLKDSRRMYRHLWLEISILFFYCLISGWEQNSNSGIISIYAYKIACIITFYGLLLSLLLFIVQVLSTEPKGNSSVDILTLATPLVVVTMYVLDKLNLSCVADLFPWVSAFFYSLLLCFAMGCTCESYHHPWCEGNMDRDTFRNAELQLSILRGIIYITCLMCVVCANWMDDFTKNKYFLWFCICLAIPLYVAILQTTFRMTFRRIANFAISLSNVIVYLTMLDLACMDSGILGFIGGENVREDFIDVLEHIPDTVKTGLLITLVAALLKDSVSSYLAVVTSPHPANQSQRRRRNRRRLLTHWHYHRNSAVSTRRDSAVELLVVEVIVFFLAIVAAVLLSVPDIISPKTDSLSDVSSNIPFAIYPISAAIIIFIPAIMSTWNITDERLIQSEYTYLTIKSSQIYSEDVVHGTPHWQDYCQVLINVYNNVSGLTSEDFGFHRMKEIISKLHSYVSNNNEIASSEDQTVSLSVCAGSRFYSDILTAKGNIDAQTLREAAHDDLPENKPIQKNDVLQRARDAQFANEIMDLLSEHYHAVQSKLDQSRASEGADILSQPSMFQLECMAEMFFEDSKHVWGQRFSPYNISADEGIKLLKMDTIIHILRRETPNKQGCGLSWLCSKCLKLNHADSEKAENERRQNRAELFYLYPFYVLECYKARWSPKGELFLLANECAQYYSKMIKQNYYMSPDLLKEPIKCIHQYFLETDTDADFVAFVSQCIRENMEEEKSNEDIPEYLSHKLDLANRWYKKHNQINEAQIIARKQAAEFATKKANRDSKQEVDEQEKAITLYSDISEIMHYLFVSSEQTPTSGGDKNES